MGLELLWSQYAHMSVKLLIHSKTVFFCVGWAKQSKQVLCIHESAIHILAVPETVSPSLWFSLRLARCEGRPGPGPAQTRMQPGMWEMWKWNLFSLWVNSHLMRERLLYAANNNLLDGIPKGIRFTYDYKRSWTKNITMAMVSFILIPFKRREDTCWKEWFISFFMLIKWHHC